MNIKILDCTLRDGGYINDWNFSDKNIDKIINALENANIDILECGYLNDKEKKDKDTTLFNKIEIINQKLSNKNKNISKVVMINFGDFDIDNLKHQNEALFDGIRLAFHKNKLKDALASAEKIISLGYKVYFQPMITKNYSDLEFLEMIAKVNTLDIYSFYIVDSFGSMSLAEFHKYLILVHNNLKSNVSLGYHSHNNMQLAFSNAISMCHMNMKREIIIDASIYGIGRGAGNLNTELITDYLNQSYEKNYDTLPLLEIIDELLNSMMKKNPWGFSPAQFLSALFNCHPNYATYLINKNTNHIVSIKKILEKVPQEKKSSFDKEFTEKLYRDFILEAKSELKGKLELDNNKKILLLASGKSVNEYLDLLKDKREDENYILIGLNHKPYIECDYYFFTNQKRYDEFNDKIESSKMVITNNIETSQKSHVILDFSKLVLEDDELITNSTLLAINYLIQSAYKTVEIAGLDGYGIGLNNYSYDENQIVPDSEVQQKENKIIEKSLIKFSKDIKINLLTPSIFKGTQR